MFNPCWPWDDPSSPSALILSFLFNILHLSSILLLFCFFPFWYVFLPFFPLLPPSTSLSLSSLSHLSVRHTTYSSVRWGRSGPRSEPWCHWRTRHWRTKMKGWMEKRRKEKKWKAKVSVPVRISRLPGMSGIWLAQEWCTCSACCFCLGPTPGVNWHNTHSYTRRYTYTLIHNPWIAHAVTQNLHHPCDPHCTCSIRAICTKAHYIFMTKLNK